MPKAVSRRVYLKSCGSLTAAIVVGGFGTGCAKKEVASASCTDTSGISDMDRQTRASLAYVDQSAIAERTCANCVLYIEPVTYGTCGACQLVKGQVSAGGHCNAWAAKGV
jgi:hypothetical protein